MVFGLFNFLLKRIFVLFFGYNACQYFGLVFQYYMLVFAKQPGTTDLAFLH